MTAGENKKMIRDFTKEFDRDIAVIEELFEPDCCVNLPGNPEPTDRSGFQQFVAMLYSAFPDLNHTIKQQVAEGDMVATIFNVRGTHKGDFMGMVPATGKEVEFDDIMIVRMREGKVVELWAQLDLLMLLQQLGVFQLPG